MTSSTPVYDLPYPDALDAPCDFPEQWCAFTDAVEGVLGRFELGASRVLPAIPVAKVQVTEQIVVPESAAIPFDTVSIDTAGWTNFDSNNRVITVPRTARYTITANATVATQGVINTTWFLQVAGGFQLVDALDRNTNDIGITAQGTGTINAGTEVSLLMLATTSLPSGFTLRSASLAVYWHADAERLS